MHNGLTKKTKLLKFF